MEHSIEISQDALDELKNTLQDTFDDQWDDIASNLTEIANLMAAANDLTVASTNTINSTLNQLLSFYGISGSSIGISSVVGYASGKKRVKDDQVALTQEDGTEAIMLPDGSILTPLSANSTVFDANRTSNLWDWGEVSPANLTSMLNNVGESIRNVPMNTEGRDMNVTFGSMFEVHGNMDSVTGKQVEEIIQKNMPNICEYTTKEIVRDFRKIK